MSTYKKIAKCITTVGQLRDALKQFKDEEDIFFTGCTNFSMAVEEETGRVLLDSNEFIDSICNRE